MIPSSVIDVAAEYRPMKLHHRLGTLLCAAGLTLTAWAQGTSGEVVKIDKGQGKVTLKHGPIQNLDMPAMSMVFRVRDPQWLDQLKAGDKIRFDAEKLNGQYTVTRLSVQQ
jgi:Cu(I)/Ag(I) efflux system periplasmic protein CusF